MTVFLTFFLVPLVCDPCLSLPFVSKSTLSSLRIDYPLSNRIILCLLYLLLVFIFFLASILLFCKIFPFLYNYLYSTPVVEKLWLFIKQRMDKSLRSLTDKSQSDKVKKIETKSDTKSDKANFPPSFTFIKFSANFISKGPTRLSPPLWEIDVSNTQIEFDCKEILDNEDLFYAINDNSQDLSPLSVMTMYK